MKIKEIMTRKVEAIHPTDTLQTAAQKMKIYDIGFLPVYEGDQLIGVVSDRDLTIRAMAEGLDPKSVMGRDLITAPVIYCFDDQNVGDAARLMHENQVRRLVILNRSDKRMVGVISLGDLAMSVNDKVSSDVLQSVSEPVIVR